MARRKREGVTSKDILMISNPDLIRVAEGFNHRVEFDEEKMAALTESIRLHGVRTPISIRADRGNKEQPYILIDGERRLRAVKRLFKEGMADPPAIPCFVNTCDEEQAFVFSAIANLERAEITASEEASIVQRLTQMGKSPKEIAQLCSRTTQWVSQRLAVASGSKAVKDAIEEGDLPVDVALQVVRNVPSDEQGDVVRDALKKSGGNKGKLREEVAKKTKGTVRPKAKDIDYVLTRLEHVHHSVRAHERPAYNLCNMALSYANGKIDQEKLIAAMMDILKQKNKLKKTA